MGGILNPNNLNLLFPMLCDIYYASETQDDIGRVNKNWIFDGSRPCSFYTLNDMSNSHNFDLDDKKFYKLETMLMGRTKGDPRVTSDGRFYPISHILITNIRAACCNDEVFFVETNGGYESVPTIYEPKMIQPYIGPYNSTEYYKIQLERSDIQVFV